MKILFWMFWTVPFFVSAQSFEYGMVTNVNQRGQLGEQTCWAASLEMLQSAYKKPTDKNDLQILYIQKKTGAESCENYQNCPEEVANSVQALTLTDLNAELKALFGGHLVYSENDDTLSGHVNQSDIEQLNWQTVKDNFKISQSPMLFWRKYGQTGEQYHITVGVGYLEIKVEEHHTAKYLLVNDPWTKKLDSAGIRYLLNFDQFMNSETNIKDSQARVVFASFKPNLSDAQTPNLIFSQDSLSHFESYIYKKKFLQSKKRAAKKFAFENIKSFSAINDSLNQNLRRFIGESQLDSLRSAKSIDVTLIGGDQYFSLTDFQRALVNGQKERYTLAKAELDTVLVHVATLNKKTFVNQRMEPYELSIAKVLNDSQNRLKPDTSVAMSSQTPGQQMQISIPSSAAALRSSFVNTTKANTIDIPAIEINDYNFNQIYHYKTYTNKPDFLLIPNIKAKQSTFILVDLFDKLKDELNNSTQINVLRGFEIPINIGSFKYKLYATSGASLVNMFKTMNK